MAHQVVCYVDRRHQGRNTAGCGTLLQGARRHRVVMVEMKNVQWTRLFPSAFIERICRVFSAFSIKTGFMINFVVSFGDTGQEYKSLGSPFPDILAFNAAKLTNFSIHMFESLLLYTIIPETQYFEIPG